MNTPINSDIVSFNRMDEGTVEDYALLDKFEKQYIKDLPERLLEALADLEHSFYYMYAHFFLALREKRILSGKTFESGPW